MQLALTAMGDERFARFRDALDEEPPVSIRLNPLKTKSMRPVDGAVVPWCNEAFYLPSRPNFTFDPLLHAGCYYVQEAASMFIDLIVRQHIPHPVTMLDLCAAPGGKSTALLAALPEGSRLVSNEPVRQRFQVLSENLAKWGHEGSIAVNRYPADFRRDGFLFDAILCDVPCSGEGMFRKDPNAIGEWSLENVERCWRLQREIVGDAWQCLVPGGLLIYSTCTFNTLENEENIRWMQRELGAEVLPVETKEEWGITGSLLPGFTAPVYRFIPGLTRSEGLFMCVMRKPSDFVQRPCTKRKSPVYETYYADVRNSKGIKKGIAKGPLDEVTQHG
ncbi:MAG: RsmB/NOP family class I SAM-dependent RNA methyltransferase, partial [Prevotella sp.]|nr:RsmB/NOP family class I SAM-dependent RNA methyltransferase [Prevotella sp.]